MLVYVIDPGPPETPIYQRLCIYVRYSSHKLSSDIPSIDNIFSCWVQLCSLHAKIHALSLQTRRIMTLKYTQGVLGLRLNPHYVPPLVSCFFIIMKCRSDCTV